MLSGKKTIRVLIIDDDEDDYFLTADYLKSIVGRTFQIEWAPNYQTGLQRIKDCQHDVYIIDYLLGAQNGIKLIREALEAKCQEPMILLTGTEDPEVDLEAAKLGVFDYLVKGKISSDSLERSIRYSLAQAANLKTVRENEQKFRTVFEKSRDMIFIADLTGKFLSVNNAASYLTGFEEEELMEIGVTKLCANASEADMMYQELMTDGELTNRKIDIRCKNGETRTCAVYVYLHTNQYGHTYCQGVLHDLTAQLREERITLLTEKMEVTGRLMRMLAHEVRNPLTNIGLALESFEMELEETNGDRTYVDIIKRNTKRISDLITQLLDSSRPTELMMQPLPILEVLQETIRETKDRIDLKKIQLITDFSHSPKLALLDREKIKIAFTNIIVNAIEAMPDTGGLLTVRMLHQNDKTLLCISDNGSGISAENLNRIFEPYFTSKSTGMGLGLAFTLNIIKAHGANVEVRSQLGEGTTFYIYFSNIS